MPTLWNDAESLIQKGSLNHPSVCSSQNKQGELDLGAHRALLA